MEVRTVEKKILREKDGRWCALEAKLEDGCLSICGSYGTVVSHPVAKKQALQFWINFFEDAPEEIIGMNRRFGRRFTSARGAAAFVLETDGELHGLSVALEKSDCVLLVEGYGQVQNELVEWFPEVTPYLKWHLNNKLGSAWKKRELPPEVIAWFAGLQNDG